MRQRIGGLSIFWQTLLLLVATLLITQLVTVGIVVGLPQPRPSFVSMAEIAEALSTPDGRQRSGDRVPEADFVVQIASAAPGLPAGMMENEALRRELAARLGIDPGQVRLYFRPDQREHFPFTRKQPGSVVPTWRGEPLFFNGVVAARDTGQGWRVMQAAELSQLNEWQRRSILILASIFLLLLLLAWFFARRLSRPISQFAKSADQLGRDVSAPLVPVTGPAELRMTAIALNGMHKRIEDYLRERTAMIAAIAHDLRTPLARIAFRVDGASDAIREPVMDDIEQMREMISATLEFVRSSAKPRVHLRLDLGALLAEMASREREMGLDVVIDLPDAAHVTGDPISLRRLFQNLIDNALAFGGSAQICVEAQEQRITVQIADTGPGLPDAMLETVFDPFVRNDPSRSRETGGVGLGLTIARSIAADHGGTLMLRNRAGGGLIAEVILARS